MAGEKTGVKVFIKVGGKTIAGQRSATFNTEKNMVDATHKQTAGWAQNIPGQGSWSIDVDGLVLNGVPGSEEETASFKSMLQAYLNDELLEIEFNDPTGISFSGQAYMTSLPIEAPMDDVMTYSTSFSGQGAFEFEEVVPGV